jgi:hypothetical protein
MKFEIHFEFRASLRKFQDLNFWDATKCGSCYLAPGVLVVGVTSVTRERESEPVRLLVPRATLPREGPGPP